MSFFNINFAKEKSNDHSLIAPDFFVKTTLVVSIVTLLVLTPFSINNFIHGRILLGLLTLSIAVICTLNAYFCYHGRYNLNLNLFLLAPIAIISMSLALHQLGVTGSYWAYLSILSFYFTITLKPALIVNIIFFLIVTPVAWVSLDLPVFMRFTAVLISTSFFAYFSMQEINKQHHMLKAQAITDSLTGLYNRSLLSDSLKKAIDQSLRTQTKMTLLMLDLDHFKKINDQFGHDTGDRVLRSIGKLMNDHFRASDRVFRIGGEEFLVLIFNTDLNSSRLLAENLRKKIEQLTLIDGHTITASIGLEELKPNFSPNDWMKQCDQKLYQAKNNGRNQTVG